MRLTARLAALFWLAAAPASAGEVSVAVAANFAEPAREIAAGFERATSHRALLSFGASGQFHAQIRNGAPFQVLLSADAERPAEAEREGLAVNGTRFTYAVGRLVLYSRDPALAKGGPRALLAMRGKVAIADPAVAPYGAAAEQALRRLGLWQRLEPRLVRGASVAQAYQFVRTGAAEAGFVALSQVIAEPPAARWLVPAADHAPILQQAVLLKPGAGSPAARAFLAFLRGPQARAVIRRYGYESP
ncbi:MAG TPA: molybdate ABC transporter substrate-binding protein [Caulobacteraceae bacterium]|jgi:molybdate transport system substrate-binding protein